MNPPWGPAPRIRVPLTGGVVLAVFDVATWVPFTYSRGLIPSQVAATCHQVPAVRVGLALTTSSPDWLNPRTPPLTNSSPAPTRCTSVAGAPSSGRTQASRVYGFCQAWMPVAVDPAT